ncbi:MAG TPA: hypothetical protein VFJ77_04415 [Gaiellaceae bacterium]|nr:hypothetical protein [Gaiellaceae bacterium]
MSTPATPRARRWTPAAIPVGILLMLLGAWVFLVPLVGPYFNFGFFTANTWVFSGVHWEMLLGPGIALFAGGLLMTMPASPVGSTGGLLAVVASVWLLVGPSLHPIWSGTIEVATPHAQWLRSLLWVGYFYGTGAIGLYLSGLLHGMLTRRPVVYDNTVIEETPSPVERRERVVTRA